MTWSLLSSRIFHPAPSFRLFSSAPHKLGVGEAARRLLSLAATALALSLLALSLLAPSPRVRRRRKTPHPARSPNWPYKTGSLSRQYRTGNVPCGSEGAGQRRGLCLALGGLEVNSDAAAG
jgi:hypothetical protein